MPVSKNRSLGQHYQALVHTEYSTSVYAPLCTNARRWPGDTGIQSAFCLVILASSAAPTTCDITLQSE